MITSLTKFFAKIRENKKMFFYLFMFIFVCYVFSDSTFAANQTTGEVTKEIKDKASEYGDGILRWLSMILALFTYLSALFLSPNWINGSLFWLHKYLHDIWILMSNLVYFVFAFILIWIAFMNIIWKTDWNYQLKQALPKFIVWVLIVPFSWFIVQFILSLSAVLTIWSLSLPFETFNNFDSKIGKVEIPKDCTLNLQSVFWTDSSQTSTQSNNDWFIYCGKDKVKLSELTAKWEAVNSIFWVFALYSYWVLSLDTIDDVDSFDLKNVKTMWDLIVKIVFDVLFVAIYMILMIAIWLVLMVRWIYIWIYMMISPVFWLMYFFDKKDWVWDWFFKKINPMEFISLAMVPVYTMLALSFWILFLFVVWDGIWWGTKTSVGWDVSLEEKAIVLWDFKLNILWQVSKPQNMTWLPEDILWAWLWIVWSLILKVFGIVILWWAVMAALWSSTITETVVAPLKQFWESVWKMVASGPANLPIFPTGAWWMQSMNSLNTFWQRMANYGINREQERWEKFASQFSPKSEYDNRINNAKRNPIWIEEAKANMDILKNSWSLEDLSKSWWWLDRLVWTLETLKDQSTDKEKAQEYINNIKNNWRNPKELSKYLKEFNDNLYDNAKLFKKGTTAYEIEQSFKYNGDWTTAWTAWAWWTAQQAWQNSTNNINFNINNWWVAKEIRLQWINLNNNQVSELNRLDIAGLDRNWIINKIKWLENFKNWNVSDDNINAIVDKILETTQ